MTQKQFDALVSPVRKLESVAERNEARLSSIELLTVAGNNIAAEGLVESKKQTSLLTDIKEHINELVVAKRQEMKEQSGGGGFKFTGIEGVKVALFMVAASIGLAAASNILSFVADVSPKQLATAALIALAFIPMTDAFIKIYKAIKPVQSNTAVMLGMANKNIGALSGGRFKPNEGAKGMDAKTALGFTIGAMIAMGAAIMIVSYFLKMMAIPSMGQIVTAALIGLSLVPLTQNLMMILKTLSKHNINADKKGIQQLAMGIATMILLATGFVAVALVMKLYPTSTVTPDITFAIVTGVVLWIYSKTFGNVIKAIGRKKPKTIAMAAGVLVLLALAAVGVAYAFALYPGDPANMPGVKFSLLAGLSLLTFSFAFVLLARNMKRVSYGDLAKAAVASVFVALAIVGTAYIFSYLGSVGAFVAPPYDWSMKAGMALLVFGLGYAGVSLLTKALGIKTMLQGIIGVAVIALAILAVGWIFNMLNGVGFVAPPISWSIAVALSLVAFTIPALAIGLIATSGIGAVGLLLGVVGMIVIAAGIWVVAWIFSKLPDLTSVSKMLTEALLTPVNGIVDVLKRLKEEIGVENLLPLAGGIIAIAGSLLVLAAASAGAAAAGLGASLMNAGKAFVDWLSGGETKGPLDILQEIVNIGPKILKLAKPIEEIGRAVSFLMGGPDMEVMNEFIYNISNYTPKKEIAEFIKSIASPFNSMIKTLSGLNEDAVKRLKALFFDVPWKSIHDPVRSVSESMTILAKSAMAAGTGVMLTANGMNIMVNALNRLTKENIDSVIKLFNEVSWSSLVDPIGSISTSIHRMSVNADKLGIGMKMSANALVLMSTIPVEVLKEIAAVFDSLAKSDLTKQGEAMLLNVAPALASISATMLVMRSDAYIRMFEVMASSSEAIVAMSRPMTNIASALDKMGGVNVDGIEWAHKMARQLARSSFNSQATAMEKIAASYKDISQSSNTMDVEAINATTDMFKALAYLYQNGRRNAMEELGEKLTEAIQELARMISDFEGTVNEQAEGSKTASEAVAKAIDGVSNKLGITSNNEGSTDSNSGEISASGIQELIDLLQSGQAKITITDLDPAAEAKLA